MNTFVKFSLFLSLFFISKINTLQPEESLIWIFMSTRTVPANENNKQVLCLGQHCDEVDIDIVKCYSEAGFKKDYTCTSSDIPIETNLNSTYTINCENNDYKLENCYVIVTLEKYIDDKPSTNKSGYENSKYSKWLKYIVAVLISQLFVAIILGPIIFFTIKANKK